MEFKKLLFSLLPRYYQINDSYKNADDKGLLERYLENIGTDTDDYTLAKLLYILRDCLDPRTALTKFLEYLEMNRGIIEPFVSSEYFKRKMLQRISTLYKIKGTKLSYEICFRMLGFETGITQRTTLTDGAYYRVEGTEGYLVYVGDGGGASPVTVGNYFRAGIGWNVVGFTGDAHVVRQTVVENFAFGGYFDSGTFDDGTFDSACDGCSNYAVELYGSGSLDVGVFRDIFRVITFCEPINARLTSVKYNGVVLLDNIITIYIDNNGDLIYINGADPDLVMTLDENGDIIATGQRANKYNIVTGDMIYTA